MRSHKFSKKTKAAVLAGVLTVGIAGGAYAYWSTTGSGTGAAANGSSNGTVTLHAAFSDGLTPGSSKSVTFTGDNAGTSNLYVGTIHLASVTVDAGHSTCDVADFTMPDVTSNTMVAAGATASALTGTGTLSFANSTVSQDACKGATVTLHLTSN
jgi:hypothetical protein